jgi:hypothetical protein
VSQDVAWYKTLVTDVSLFYKAWYKTLLTDVSLFYSLFLLFDFCDLSTHGGLTYIWQVLLQKDT